MLNTKKKVKCFDSVFIMLFKKINNIYLSSSNMLIKGVVIS